MMVETRKLYPIFTIILFIFISFSISVNAEPENVLIKINPIHDEISIHDEAIFNISVLNLRPYQDLISIYSPNIDSWSVIVSPGTLNLGPGELGHTILRLKPKSNIIPGMEYGVQLNFRANRISGFQTAHAFVNVKTQEQINTQYLPILTVDIPEIDKVDPTKPLILTVELENKNVRDIKDLELYMKSGNIYEQKTITDLGPLQKKSVQFTLNTKSSTPPQKNNIILTLRLDNQTIISRSVNYEIMEVEMQDYRVDSVSSFMMNTHHVSITNEGNVKTIGEHKIKTNLLNYFFIRSDIKGNLIRIDNKFYKQYTIELNPEESYNFKVIISYRPIAYAIIAILILISLYYIFRSPLMIRKSVSSIKMKEGSLSELKILLHIKNRTRKTFDDLIILDRIPKITEVKKDFEMGTIKPSKVMMHEKKGTIIRWDINSLDSYEERVIAYKLSTNLNILGGLTLPIAVLKYIPSRGKERKISSNKIKLVIQSFSGEKK
jgi:hypothetical protein